MEEDASLSKFLQNPTFLRPEDIELPDIRSLDMPLICRAEDQIRAADGADIDLEVESLPAEPQLDDLRPLKRRKMVHFG